jgi:hypothetical protein
LLVRQKLGKVFYLAATLLAVSLVGGVAVADSGAKEKKLPQAAWLDRTTAGTTPLVNGVRDDVGSLELGPGAHLVNASVTVSAADTAGNMVCRLVAGESVLAVGNARGSGGAATNKGTRESFALTAIAQAESVSLDCLVDNSPAGGSATDVSITGVQVASP